MQKKLFQTLLITAMLCPSAVLATVGQCVCDKDQTKSCTDKGYTKCKCKKLVCHTGISGRYCASPECYN